MNKLFLSNISELVTCKGLSPKCGNDMSDVGIIHDGCVVIDDGKIIDVGKYRDIIKHYSLDDYKEIDCSKNAVLPGFVDSHTHFIFSGYRQEEFTQRLNGASYIDILKRGGGIANTVTQTRCASLDNLVELGIKRADTMLGFGVTTVEGKSGYGLDLDTEIKQLKVMKKINEIHPIDVVPTFLGAHFVPKEFEGEEKRYLDFLIDIVLPKVKKEGLAEFVDIFCEKGVFNIEQSRYYLSAAKKMGYRLKIHADEIAKLGGANLAAELGATSADHLLNASQEGMKAMAMCGVIATLLPATAFSLKEDYADAKKMINLGCAIALATDFNPGSSFTNSIPLVIALSALHMGMTINEIVCALTINGACALGLQDEVGSIEIGKKADVIILEYPSIDFLAYNVGMNMVKSVIKNGKVVVERKIV